MTFHEIPQQPFVNSTDFFPMNLTCNCALFKKAPASATTCSTMVAAILKHSVKIPNQRRVATSAYHSASSIFGMHFVFHGRLSSLQFSTLIFLRCVGTKCKLSRTRHKICSNLSRSYLWTSSSSLEKGTSGGEVLNYIVWFCHWVIGCGIQVKKAAPNVALSWFLFGCINAFDRCCESMSLGGWYAC